MEGAGPLESMSVATPGAATSTTSVTSRRRRRSLPPSRSRDGEISRPGGSSASSRRTRQDFSTRNSICTSLSLSLSFRRFSKFYFVLDDTQLGTHHRSPILVIAVDFLHCSTRCNGMEFIEFVIIIARLDLVCPFVCLFCWWKSL